MNDERRTRGAAGEARAVGGVSGVRPDSGGDGDARRDARRALERLVLFDIDGTLLNSNGAGRAAMEHAGRALYGERFDMSGVEFAGKLDRNIWREVCVLNHLDHGRAQRDRFHAAYVARLEELLDSGAWRVDALAGMGALLERLWARPDAVTGILSGNWPESGALKVAAAGFAPERFAVGAWGSDGERREDLLPVAVERCEAALGWRPDAARVVIVGDTPDDVKVARHHGARCLAVLTGWSDRAALEAAGADWVVDDVSDTDAVEAWVLGG